MCTAITFCTEDHYFGRNLDLEYSYSEEVTITPRNFPFPFRYKPAICSHYAMIGIATVVDDYPLYYDATNEMGLSMAGLNFPGNAVYRPVDAGRDNITPFEFIPWILCQCATVSEAEVLLRRINLTDSSFSSAYPLSPLHWILSDKDRTVTVEPMLNGLQVINNPVGILTNNPPFLFHLENLNNYLNVTHSEATNRFSPQIPLAAYSRGMGGIGLPGDLSSASRFVRAAFTKFNSRCNKTENESVSQFFHILGSVSQQCGCVKVGDAFEKTVYSSCCNTDKCVYYYTTYDNSQITGVSLFHEDLLSGKLIGHPLRTRPQIWMEN